MADRKKARGIIAQEPPGLQEVAARLSEILERSNAIDEQLRTLEILKQSKSKVQKDDATKKPAEDKYVPFKECNDCVCRPVPKVPRGARLAGSSQNALCQIMDLINDLRQDVSALATRQNQMKDELERIRTRLC